MLVDAPRQYSPVEVVEGGDILDARGNVIGQLNKRRFRRRADGSVIPKCQVDWYVKPQASQPTQLPEVGARTVTDVGQFKRSLNIAPDAGRRISGRYLWKTGSVVDKKDRSSANFCPDGFGRRRRGFFDRY